MIILFIFLLILLFFINSTDSKSTTTTTISPRARTVKDIPNPITNSELCGRLQVSKSSICDPDLILVEDDKDMIEGYLNAITKSEIGLLIINEMKPDEKLLNSYSKTNDIDVMNMAKSFSIEVHNEWGVGSKTTNNGILIFLSIKDRVIYLSTGSGVHHLFPQLVIDNIISIMKSYLRNQDYTQAILNCIVQIDLILSGKENSELKNKYPNGATSTYDFSNIISYLMYSFVIAWVVISTYWNYEEQQKLKSMQRGQVVLERLIKEVDGHTDDFIFHSTSCPICLEIYPQSDLNNDESSATTINANDAQYDLEKHESLNDDPVVRKKNNNTTNTLSTSSTKNDILSNRRPMGLQCGHTFCFECLETYLKTNSGRVCPICRAPVDLQPSNHPHIPPSQSQAPTPSLPIPPQNTSQNPQQISPLATTSTVPIAHTPIQSTQQQQQHPHVSQERHDTPPSSNLPTNRPRCSVDSFEQQPEVAITNTIIHNSSTNELLYRAERMHILYPHTMTSNLLRSIRLSLHNNSIYEYRNHLSSQQIVTQRTITSIQQRIADLAKANGRNGTIRSSFGGGSFRGGGGGRW